MKPSEQFADLKVTVDGMDACQDKTDLLALFEEADALWMKVDAFGRVVGALKRSATIQRDELEQDQAWRKKWEPLMRYVDDMAEREYLGVDEKVSNLSNYRGGK